MSKVKYKFNKKSLTFDRVHTTMRKRLLYFFSHLSTGVVFAAVVLVIAYNFLDSPKEKAQKREGAEHARRGHQRAASAHGHHIPDRRIGRGLAGRVEVRWSESPGSSAPGPLAAGLKCTPTVIY